MLFLALTYPGSRILFFVVDELVAWLEGSFYFLFYLGMDRGVNFGRGLASGVNFFAVFLIFYCFFES